MRKRIIPASPNHAEAEEGSWLRLEDAADVEITSEHAEYPIENAFGSTPKGWRAAQPGAQTIRLIFSSPQLVRRIWLHFEESEMERTQEFVLRWSADNGKTHRDVLRQQWTFSPGGIHEETENMYLNLEHVTELELTIWPEISGGQAIASLSEWRIG